MLLWACIVILEALMELFSCHLGPMPALDRDPIIYRRALIVLAHALIALIISHHDYRTYIWFDPEASVKVRL